MRESPRAYLSYKRDTEEMMRLLGTLLTTAAVVSMTVGVVPAEARDWKRGHHKHGYYKHGSHYGHHWRRGHHRHHRNNGAGIALGLLGGALAGAAIASATNPYYYPYSY